MLRSRYPIRAQPLTLRRVLHWWQPKGHKGREYTEYWGPAGSRTEMAGKIRQALSMTLPQVKFILMLGLQRERERETRGQRPGGCRLHLAEPAPT